MRRDITILATKASVRACVCVCIYHLIIVIVSLGSAVAAADRRREDADDFEIPSLKPEKEESTKSDFNGVKKAVIRKEKAETGPIYLGPHGAPPSQLKQQELNTASGKKNKWKQKLKDSEKRGVSFGRENKVDTIRDLMGGKSHYQSPRGTQSDWLDPHLSREPV